MKTDINTPAESNNQRMKSEMRVYFGASQQKLLTGFTVDLSAGGLYLQTDYPFEVDENLRIRFTLPSCDKVVSCEARVAWVNLEENPRKPELPPGIGVQFVDVSLDDIKSIRSFLKHNIIEPRW